MWLRILALILGLLVVFATLGLYAGGAFYLHGIGGDPWAVQWHTLIDTRLLSLHDRRLLFAPWAWCVMVAITFLPVGMVILALFLRLKPRTDLHGNARFATNAELRQFEYQGEYKNTSRK